MAAQRHRLQLAIKRAVDVVVAAVALVLLSPLMAVIAAAILLTMGPPVLFRHRRLGLGGGLGSGESSVQFDLVDINGDGLPDRITKNGAAASCGSASLCVAFNLGYGFAAFEPWGAAPVSDGASNNASVSGSLGFNGGIYDFAGGLSLDKNTSQAGCASADLDGGCGTTAPVLIDVNGDGLLDRVRASGSELQVAFNTGNGFGPDSSWGGALPGGESRR